MLAQKIRANRCIFSISVAIMLVLVISGCEKLTIKRLYTGDFMFTSIITDTDYSTGPTSVHSDTITTSGTIEYVRDKVILIKVGEEQFVVTADGDGNLVLYNDPDHYDPHGNQNLTGQFENKNSLSFVYNKTYSFSGHHSFSKRIVTGIRQ